MGKSTKGKRVVEQVATYIKKWQAPLGLNAYYITIRASTKQDISDATEQNAVAVVYVHPPLLQATLHIAADWPWGSREGDPDYNLETVVVHELGHIRLAEVETGMWDIISNLQAYLPEAVDEMVGKRWHQWRENTVNTLVGVAMEGERHWRK